MFKLYFLISLTIFAITSGHVIREAPPTSDILSLENVLTIAENGLKKAQELVLQTFEAANTDELKNKAEVQGESVVNQIKSWMTNIKQTTDEWQDNISVKELHEIAVNALDGFKAEHPKLTSEVTGYVDSVTKTSEKVLEQIKEISKSEQSTQLKELSEKLLESTKASFLLIGNELKDAIISKDALKPKEVEQLTP